MCLGCPAMVLALLEHSGARCAATPSDPSWRTSLMAEHCKTTRQQEKELGTMAIGATVPARAAQRGNLTLVSCVANTPQPTRALAGENSTIECRVESFFVIVSGPGKHAALADGD